MNKLKILPLAVSAITTLALPLSVFAHGHSEFKIGNKIYQFVVGSLNEPIAVDDKTGVDIRISQVVGGHDEDTHHEDEQAVTRPVAGLEADLKVELIAGDKKKVYELNPTYNTPGSYRANFIPTVQTTYTYRVFGRINGVDVDLPFTCNPAGHPRADDDTTVVEISPGVTQLEKGGAFGCPVARAELGFPESSLTDVETKTAMQGLAQENRSSRFLGMTGVVLGILGLIGVGGIVFMKR